MFTKSVSGSGVVSDAGSIPSKRQTLVSQPDVDYAPEGFVFMCMACGKTAKSIYGADGDYGWDESCAINCKLVSIEELIDGEDA